MTKQRTIKLLAAAAVLAVIAAGSVSGAPRAKRGSMTKVSNRGHHVRLSLTSRRMVRSLGGNGVAFLMGVRSSRAFYRIDHTAKGTAYGSGPAGNVGTIGGIKGATRPPFPSGRRPVLDLSVADLNPATSETHIVRVGGIAADGISSIGFIAKDGSIIGRVPVINNIYESDAGPDSAVTGLVGFNPGNVVVYEVDYHM